MTATATATKTLAEELGVEVGTIFTCSWGYDQTNVDFYKVIEITPSGKSVKVQKWGAKVDHSDYHDYLVAGDGPVTRDVYEDEIVDGVRVGRRFVKKEEAPIRTHRLREGYQDRAAFTVNSFSTAYVWDGKPEYQTGAHYGH